MTLNQQIPNLTQQAEALRRQERNPSTDPRLAHEAGVSAERLEGEIQKLTQHRAGNLEMIGLIAELIRFLEASPHKSAHRTLALRHLEDAQSRLIRETGN